MADPADIAAEEEERFRLQALAARPSADPAPGTPGECDLCGRWCGRLVQGACGFCRDKYKLP